MSLEKWSEYGWLKAEPTSRDEIQGLLGIIERDLKDATVAGVSEDRRFEAAFPSFAASELRSCEAANWNLQCEPPASCGEMSLRGSKKIIPSC